MFAYCENSPVANYDPKGEFVLSTLAMCMFAGAVIGAIAGGIAGNAYADYCGYTGAEKAEWIAVGALSGGIAGAVIGCLAAPTVASVTGVAGISISSAGVSTIAAISPSVILFGKEVSSSGQIISLLREFFEKNKVQMTLEEIKSLYELCNSYSIKFYATLNDLAGHGDWAGIPHVHIGDKRVHIALTDAAVEFVKRVLGYK